MYNPCEGGKAVKARRWHESATTETFVKKGSMTPCPNDHTVQEKADKAACGKLQVKKCKRHARVVKAEALPIAAISPPGPSRQPPVPL